MEQTQIPDSSHAFDSVQGTDGDPNHTVLTQNTCSHREPALYCMVPWAFYQKGYYNITVPLWRMNGAGENDPKIPVILAHGIFGNRFGMDYSLDGEIYSLARFLANRGRDVWIIEWQQSFDESSQTYWDYLWLAGWPWKTWTKEYLTTDDPAIYAAWDAFFEAQDYCTHMTVNVSTGDLYTATFDDLVWEDTPAIIAAILHITNQTQIQWVGHSLGGLTMFGFMPTQLTSNGKENCGKLDLTTWVSLPPNSILSLTTIGSPTALINVPGWLQTLRDTGQLSNAWIYRAKLPRYFRYLQQEHPKAPVKLTGIIDTSQLAHLEEAIDLTYFSFFIGITGTPQYYHLLYEGNTLKYPYPEAPQFTVYGHTVSTPVTAIYDGKGFDEFGTLTNINFGLTKLSGYSCRKPFFQFSPATTSHIEMINGYIFEGGIPGWPPHLQYDYGGTYHYIWYDLYRYLPPAPFNAYSPDYEVSTPPHISWQNNRDAVSYELWAKQGLGSFTKKGSAANEVASAADCQSLSSGVWKIKVRAYSLGGSWRDHSGASSIGDADDESKWIEVNVA